MNKDKELIMQNKIMQEKTELRINKIERLEQARKNLFVLIALSEKGIDVNVDIASNIKILNEVHNIGNENFISTKEELLFPDQIFQKELKEKLLFGKNICEEMNAVIEKAKKMGCELKITNNGAELYKKGEKVEFLDVGVDPIENKALETIKNKLNITLNNIIKSKEKSKIVKSKNKK